MTDIPICRIRLISLPGSYTIEAGSAAAADAAWDQPVYYGTQQFDVKAGDVLSLSVTCSLSNMKVTVTCTDKLLQRDGG